ncbi:hypothetical protein BGX23_007598 [Mortierella sp. AD031]|nr:hypothetical protein BGX23_007598 [Mortierella sp. AD031]
MNVTWTYADKRKVVLEKFMKTSLPTFIADHEFHLRSNGSNGHYIGNKGNTSQPSLQKSELITMVRENVEKNAEIAAWRSTDEWKELAHGSVMGYAITIVPDEKEKDGES